MRGGHDRGLGVCSGLKRRRGSEGRECWAWCLGDIQGTLPSSCAVECGEVGVNVRCGLSACDLFCAGVSSRAAGVVAEGGGVVVAEVDSTRLLDSESS